MSRKRAKLLSDKLREARLKAGLTQSQLASFLDTTSTYVYMIESGRRLNPSLDVLRKWAKACGATLTDML